ncbi:hypothetical protein CWI39_0244p0010 [Hamiltosporidium magnivora]|uniref:Uncharacterized protein n=1 Tax=Hamiltosporidium magnivora TaxID=148818 RepID=A0A4Q9LLG3_9MICR|nr:hypothetical protein CWI39_0244p0010 [Hamiltosporidium magnivora]
MYLTVTIQTGYYASFITDSLTSTSEMLGRNIHSKRKKNFSKDMYKMRNKYGVEESIETT